MMPIHRKRARQSITTALKKRRLPVPKGKSPILTRPMAHPEHTKHLQQFLRQRVDKHRDLTIPFHTPSTKVIYRRHPYVQELLRNWRRAHHMWRPNDPPACTCKHLQQAFPQHVHQDHIAAPLQVLCPSQKFLEFSGKSTVFPKLACSTTQLRQAITKWHICNQLPAPQADDMHLDQFLQHQAAPHKQASQHHLNIRIVQAISSTIPDGVVHAEDHRPGRLLWLCPQLYHQAITATFQDPTIFQQSPAPPLTFHMHINQQLSHLLPRYRKHFQDWGKIPTAYILPKRKKQFSKGRPIVAFVQLMARPIWQALADLLASMTQQACPDSLGQGDGISQLKQLRSYIYHQHDRATEQHGKQSYHPRHMDRSHFRSTIRILQASSRPCPRTALSTAIT